MHSGAWELHSHLTPRHREFSARAQVDRRQEFLAPPPAVRQVDSLQASELLSQVQDSSVKVLGDSRHQGQVEQAFLEHLAKEQQVSHQRAYLDNLAREQQDSHQRAYSDNPIRELQHNQKDFLVSHSQLVLDFSAHHNHLLLLVKTGEHLIQLPQMLETRLHLNRLDSLPTLKPPRWLNLFARWVVKAPVAHA